MQNIVVHNSNFKPQTPVVGDGATGFWLSDRRAFTVIEILSPKCIVVQADTAIRTDKNGMSESQEYTFERNPKGQKYVVTLRKNGKWVPRGYDMYRTPSFLLGHRSEYCDPSF